MLVEGEGELTRPEKLDQNRPSRWVPLAPLPSVTRG